MLLPRGMECSPQNPTNCAYDTHLFIKSSLSCPKGSFPSIRHNEIRDTIGHWMSEVLMESNLQSSTEAFHDASA